ncbi:hypothetical protein TNCT_674061 [Trichonephila clavata]|uniref:Uncharacterized protein n=1 Tax=Trichonephila clavata TaxID=2740835 RepID=A0A8X6KJW8_TRICU|nr:hypothetical protein TNCT_674061 [Trichonephila clavata]
MPSLYLNRLLAAKMQLFCEHNYQCGSMLLLRCGLAVVGCMAFDGCANDIALWRSCMSISVSSNCRSILIRGFEYFENNGNDTRATDA